MVDMAVMAPAGELSQTADASERFLRFVEGRDPRILEGLIREHLDRSFSQACRLLGTASEAEDAVQEALVQLVRTADRYDGSVPFPAWLGQLVHSASIQAMRTNWRRKRREQRARLRMNKSGNVFSPSPHATEEEDPAEAVRAAVSELPERYRATVDLHYFAGLSQRDTAKALGCKEDAVAKRLERARDCLRSLLKRRGVALSGGMVTIALASAPAHAAPSSLIASSTKLVSGLSGSAVLPASTLPFGFGATVLQPLTIAAALMIGAAVVGIGARDLFGVASRAESSDHRQIDESWDFSRSAPQGLALLNGDWRWTPGQNGFPAAMRPDGRVAIALPVDVDRTPVLLTARIHIPQPVQRFGLMAGWISADGQALMGKQSRAEVPPLEQGKSHTYRFYLTHSATILVLDGVVQSVFWDESPEPSHRIFFHCHDLDVESLSLRSATAADLPDECRDVDAFVAAFRKNHPVVSP